MRRARYSLRLLGTFDILRNGRRVTDRCHGKMRALLAYLAAESGQMHTRQALAGLLWPERDDVHARQSLRQALTGLRSALEEPDGAEALLTIGRDTVGFSPGEHDTDIAVFDALKPTQCDSTLSKFRVNCRQCHLAAVSHYRGPFLAGLSVPDAPEFESWLELKRERYNRLAAELFGHLAACHEQSGEYAEALKYARAQLRVDPWQEDAHRQLIRLLALGGARNAALAHYRRVRKLLADELGVAPEQATHALYEAVRAGRVRKTRLSPAERLTRSSPWDARKCAVAPHGHAGERRLLTVLSAELRCAPDDDPEELHERSRRFEQAAPEVVRRHGGAIYQSENLDLTAYFGYPEPCEQAAFRAVSVALDLGKALGNLAPRIRVHTGVVFVPPRLRGPCEPDFSVVGSVPRLARALHSALPDVRVVVSETTFAVVRHAVRGCARASHRIPDTHHPLAVYEVTELVEAAQTQDVTQGRFVNPTVTEQLERHCGGMPLAFREREEHALDRLGSAQALAQLAANLGETFSEEELQRLLDQAGNLGREASVLSEELDVLLSAGVLESHVTDGTVHYRFQSRLLRQVAYERQSKAQRRLCRQLLSALSKAPACPS